MKQYKFLIIILCIISSSCSKDWYDVKSDKSITIPTSLKDFQSLMDNADILNYASPGLGEIGSDNLSLAQDRILTLDATNRNAYTWSHEQPYIVVPDWITTFPAGAYIRVYYCNIVLDGLEKVIPDGDIELTALKNIKGQALFHRARTFYELSQVFAPPYEATTATNQLGIPLRLESDVNIPSSRSTLQQTYEQIINDLIVAKELLPLTALYKTRPSKAAALGLLARIYLSMENYTKAEEYASQCLSIHNSLIDFNNPAEVNLTSARPMTAFNKEVIFACSMAGYTANNISILMIEPALYDLYNNNDLRKVACFSKNNTTGIIRFKGSYSGNSGNHFTGLAAGEIYLIRAECYARRDKKDEALKDLNDMLRPKYKTGTFVNFSAATSEDALKLILTERRKELLLRGLRWSDLRRLNRDNRFKVTLTRVVGNKTYSLEPNSYKYTFPIPDDIIAISGIQQNPGWDK